MIAIGSSRCSGPRCFSRVKNLTLLILLGFSCLLAGTCLAQSTERRLLLVSGEQSQTGSFTHAELRKIFLGVTVIRNGVRIKPLLNSADSLAMNVFLQRVIYMSEREYKRQLVSRVFRLGDQRPREYDDVSELGEALRSMPGSLTFMWSDQLERQTGLQSLGVLWESSGE